MKKLLLIFGATCLILGVLFLLFGAFSRFGYYHVLDGSSELYNRLHDRMVLGFAAGPVLAALGGVCLIFRARM